MIAKKVLLALVALSAIAVPSTQAIDHLKNALDDLQFHFTHETKYDDKIYEKLIDCITDGGNDMVLYQAHNQSWKAIAELWQKNGNIIDYNGYYQNFGTGFSYFESDLGGQQIGRYDIRITEPCNHVSSLAYYKVAMQICKFSKQGRWHIPRQTQRDLVRAVSSIAVGSSLYHGMSNDIGMDYDMTTIAFMAYIQNQIILDNFPMVTSVLREFSYIPRKKNVSEALDEVIQSIATDDVNTWHKTMMEADIRANYDLTVPCIIGTFASLTLPSPIANYIHELAVSVISNPVDQHFMQYQYFADLQKAAAQINIPLDQRMQILLKLVGAGFYLFFGLEFTENRAVLLDFDKKSTLDMGAFFLPMFSVISHLFSGDIFDWELAASEELYPGQLSCRYAQPHSVWHEVTASALFDLMRLTDYIYYILGRSYQGHEDVHFTPNGLFSYLI